MKVKFNSTVPFRHSAEGRLISLIDANGFTTGYTYDANGNLTTKKNKTTAETTTYTWDYEGRLIKAVMPNGLTNTYKYDPFGRRVEKSVNGTITRYVYDNEDILFEYNNAGALAAKYTHDPGVDEPLSVDMLGKLYYYNADALGSVTGITDAGGNPAQRYTYDSFGKIVTQLSAYFKQPYAFTGREYDQETGLYYYRNRYYDLNTGRFVSKDPIGFAGDVNLYRYVGNNPVNYTDPEGLKTWMCEKPLDVICKLGMECSGTKKFADYFWNPLYHQYICVGNEKSPVCGGQSGGGKPYGPGEPSNNDKFNPDNCKEKEPDNECIEKCILEKVKESRPKYGFWDPWTNCQEWADNAMVGCWRKCKGK